MMGKKYVAWLFFKTLYKNGIPSADVELKRRARQIKALSIVQFWQGEISSDILYGFLSQYKH